MADQASEWGNHLTCEHCGSLYRSPHNIYPAIHTWTCDVCHRISQAPVIRCRPEFIHAGELRVVEG